MHKNRASLLFYLHGGSSMMTWLKILTSALAISFPDVLGCSIQFFIPKTAICDIMFVAQSCQVVTIKFRTIKKIERICYW